MNRPNRLTTPNWDEVTRLVEEHLTSVEDGETDLDYHFDDRENIFEALLTAMYGEQASDWYDKLLTRASKALSPHDPG